MSFFFQTTFIPLIENLLQNHSKRKNSRKNQSRKKFQSDQRSKVNEKEYKTNQKNNIFKAQIFQTWQTRQRQSDQKYDQMSQRKSAKSHSQSHIFFNFSDNHNKVPKALQKSNTMLNQSYSKSQKIQSLSKNQKNSSIKSQNYHAQLQQTLIKSAASQKESQRLAVIFESARKPRDQIYKNTQMSNKNSSKLLNEVNVDEVSRRIMRRSFCLQMIEDDNEWESVLSTQMSNKSKSKKKRQD